MLIPSFLPNSLNTALSFMSDLGKQHNMELFCDWSHCGGIWQKSSNGKRPLDNWEKSIPTGEEGSKSSCSSIVEISRTTTDASFVEEDMSTNSISKWDGFVYKRRRLTRTTDNLWSEQNAIDCDKEIKDFNSSMISSSVSLTIQKDGLPKNPVLAEGSSLGQCSFIENSLISKESHQQKSTTIPCSKNSVSVVSHLKSTSEYHSHSRYLSSRLNTGQGSEVIKSEMDFGECSSSDVIVTKPPEEFTSANELCISFLKTHGLLLGTNTCGARALSELLRVGDANVSRPCKICSLLESPLKMMICDLCEDAFHVSCCYPKVQKIPFDYWHCQPCFRKKPEAMLEKYSGKPAKILSEHGCRNSRGRGSRMLSMLRDDWPCTSGVGIGKDFQAEVPEWTGPVSEYVLLMP